MDYNYINYVDGYYQTYAPQETEEEEEWDRQAYLDPMWEIQQKKTFTAWCNSYLRKVKTSISNIEDDFQNGLKLIQLLETLSEEQLPKPDRGRMRFHKIANVNKALEYIESKGVQLVSIGAEEIVDGNIKMTLGMIWTIILRFCIQDITVEEMSAKEGLLLWCQRKTAPYKNVNVQNFHMSWKDGLAFCALIHRHRPDLIDYAKLSRDNPLDNLNYAFDVAEKHLDIPRMLDAEDMVNTVRPDERSVMTYVAAYYHALAGPQKAESAASRITKVINSNQENARLMQEYENLTSDLLSWICQKVLFLKDRDTDGTLTGACSKLGQYHTYRGDEKPPKLESKTVLENLFNTLQNRLRLANRPSFLPTEGHLISDINSAWREMENYEKGFEDWLLAEIKRLEQIEFLVKKFRLKCSTHEQWAEGKAEQLDTADYEGAGLSTLRAMLQKHTAFEADLGSHQSRVERIVAIAEELNSLRYHDVKSVNERTEKIVAEWDRLGQLSQTRKEGINRLLDVHNRLDQLQLSLAKRIESFNSWLEQAQEDLQDMFIVNKVEEIMALISGHENFKKTLPTAEREMVDMLMEASQAEAIVREYNLSPQLTVNPYTMVDHKTLKRRWETLSALVSSRDQELQAELFRQQEHDRLRRTFAEVANHVGPLLERYLDALHGILTSPNVRLDERLHQLQNLQEETGRMQSNFGELDTVSRAVETARIVGNPYTRYTMETLRVGREQLTTNLARSQNELENQILARDSRGVTEKQMEECRRCFNHFDRQRQRRLDPMDFKACLVSLGYSIPNNAKGEADFQRILRSVDPNAVGYITFDSFMHFMTRQMSEVESAETMAELFGTLAGDNPYITAEQLRRELPSEQAEYCIKRMKPYSRTGGEAVALDYTSFANELYGESDL